MRDCNKSKDKILYFTKLVIHLVEIHKGCFRWWETGGKNKAAKEAREHKMGQPEKASLTVSRGSGGARCRFLGEELSSPGKASFELAVAWSEQQKEESGLMLTGSSQLSVYLPWSAIKAMLNWTCADPIPLSSCPSNLPPSRDYPTGYPLWLLPFSAV